jgi:hypothetical protein
LKKHHGFASARTIYRVGICGLILLAPLVVAFVFVQIRQIHVIMPSEYDDIQAFKHDVEAIIEAVGFRRDRITRRHAGETSEVEKNDSASQECLHYVWHDNNKPAGSLDFCNYDGREILMFFKEGPPRLGGLSKTAAWRYERLIAALESRFGKDNVRDHSTAKGTD